jgi:hypothetical protein
MAIPKIKATYSLDVETAETLEDLARRWNVTKSEALRRAIHLAKGQALPRIDPLRALEELQEKLNLSTSKARRWEKMTREERLSSSEHLESTKR